VVPILACFAIIQFTWLSVTTIPGLYIFTTFYGIASAGFQCLIPSTMASITPEMNRFGTRLGMAFSTVSIAALTGPPLGGAIQGAMDGRWYGAQAWAGVAMAICFCFLLGARVSKVGWTIRARC
jgi:MFS family permease